MSATRILSIIVALTTPFFVVAEEEAKNDSKNTRMIEINPRQPLVALGAEIHLQVVYSNQSDRAWKLEQPESSAAVKVTYQLVKKGDLSRMRFSLSKRTFKEVKRPDGTTETVWLMPPRTEIEIKPGEKREFTVDIYSRWTADLVPGQYEAWVEDVEQKLKSNRITFTLAFSKDSVPALLATAADEKESPAKRKWCSRWLKKIKPDFELKFKEAKDSPDTSAVNAKAIREFKEFWDKAKDSKEIEALFPKPDQEPHKTGNQAP